MDDDSTPPTGYTPNPSPAPIVKECLVNATEKQPLLSGLGSAESGSYRTSVLAGPKASAKAVKERRWVTVLMVVAAAFSSVLCACVLGFPSAALLDLTESESRKEFKFDNQLKDLFGLMGPLGALCGGPVSGVIADRLGRKVALVLMGLPYFCGFLTLTYAHFITNPLAFKIVLMMGRFFTGAGLGWSSITSPIYIAEISSAKLRGVAIGFRQILLCVGLIVVYLLGSFQSFKYYHSALVISGIAVIYVMMAVFVCETPRWLLMKGYRNRAIATLKKLRGEHFDIQLELDKLETDIARIRQLKLSEIIKSFSTRSVLAPLFTVIFAVFFQQVGGLTAATGYSAPIFKSADVKNYRQTATYASGGIQLVSTIVSVLLIDVFGRKLLLIISGAGTLVGTVMLGTHFYITRPSLCHNATVSLSQSLLHAASSVPDDIDCNKQFAPLAIVSLVIFYAAFTFGWGPIPAVLLGEMLPLRVRGVASGVISFLSWGTAAIVSGSYFNYSQAVKPWFAWWSFSLANLAGIVFVAFFVFETKGKSLEEIEERFKSKLCIQCG